MTALLAPDVQHVVGDLEGDAELAAVAVEGRHGGLRGAGVRGTQAAAHRGQLGGLPLDDREVRRLVQVEVAAVVDLLHLPLADLVGRVADPSAGAGGVERGRQVEGVGEEVVAQQDGGLVAPLGVDRGGVPADHRLVEDVVVHQGRGVDHLDDRREHAVRRRQAPAGAAREQHQGRPQSLPLEVGAVVDQVLHERETAAQLLLEDPLGIGQLAPAIGAYRSDSDQAALPLGGSRHCS